MKRSMMELNNSSDRSLMNEHERLYNIIKDVEKKIKNKSSYEELEKEDLPLIVAGNIRNINDVLWFYIFGIPMTIIGPNETVSPVVSITHEAPFSVINIQKVIFKVTNPNLPNASYEYINPQIESGIATGLKFSMMNGETSRTYHDEPISLDHIGDARFPTKLSSPVLIERNSNLEVNLFNKHDTNTYAVAFDFFGYRVKFEKMSDLLSIVTD